MTRSFLKIPKLPARAPGAGAQVEDPPRPYRYRTRRGARDRGRPFPQAAAGCTHRYCPVQEGDRLSPGHEALVAVPEDDLVVFPSVPVEVLRCLPGRDLAGEGYYGWGREEVNYS